MGFKKYLYFRSVENPVDIFIRQQSRECETILEEDEADLSEWYSTRTSHGLNSNEPPDSQTPSRGFHRSRGSSRRKSSFNRPDSPLKKKAQIFTLKFNFQAVG